LQQRSAHASENYILKGEVSVHVRSDQPVSRCRGPGRSKSPSRTQESHPTIIAIGKTGWLTRWFMVLTSPWMYMGDGCRSRKPVSCWLLKSPTSNSLEQSSEWKTSKPTSKQQQQGPANSTTDEQQKLDGNQCASESWSEMLFHLAEVRQCAL